MGLSGEVGTVQVAGGWVSGWTNGEAGDVGFILILRKLEPHKRERSAP